MTAAAYNNLRSYLYYPSPVYVEGAWEIRKVAGHGKKRYHLLRKGKVAGRYWTFEEAKGGIK